MNIIVSGASQGIGYEVVSIMAQKQHKVLAIARNEKRLKELAGLNENIHVLAYDLENEMSSSELKSFFHGEEVDVLINNAGQLINKPFLETSICDFKKQYTANVITAISLIQAAYPLLKDYAHIVNISSMGGVQGSSKFNGLSAYSSAKGALTVLSECLAEEFKEKAIHVNALALGAVETKMLKTAFPDYKAPLNAEEMAEFIADFSLHGQRFFNGKILEVALGNP